MSVSPQHHPLEFMLRALFKNLGEFPCLFFGRCMLLNVGSVSFASVFLLRSPLNVPRPIPALLLGQMESHTDFLGNIFIKPDPPHSRTGRYKDVLEALLSLNLAIRLFKEWTRRIWELLWGEGRARKGTCLPKRDFMQF